MVKIRIALSSLFNFWHKLDDIKNDYGSFKILYLIDWIISYFFHGASPNDYFEYSIYEKSNILRKNIITYRRHNKIDRKYNNYDKDTSIIGNKAKFLKILDEDIKREYVCSGDCTLHELLKFLENKGTVVFKPVSLCKGEGVVKLLNNHQSKSFIKEKYLTGLDFIIEEIIKPHKAISMINPNCVNSLRIYTFLKEDGCVEILGAFLKTPSRDSFVDNIAVDGIVFPIELNYGIIKLPGKAFLNNSKVYFHPLTGIKMIGFEIPHFKKAIDLVKKCSKKFENFRYLGWDIAITNNSVEIIEANLSPDPRILQSDGYFKYDFFK